MSNKHASYEPVIAEGDNFNRNDFINHTFTDYFHTVHQQKEALNNNVLTFEFPALSPGLVYDLGSLRMSTKMALTDKDGDRLPNDTMVAPINYFAQTVIKSVEIYLNDLEVSNSAQFYSEMALVDGWFNHSMGDRHGSMQISGFYADLPQYVDSVSANNNGFQQRRGIFGHSTNIGGFEFNTNARTIHTHIKSDINTTDLPLLSGVSVRVVIKFHENDHNLWTNATGKTKNPELQFQGSEMRMTVRRCAEGFARSIEEKLSKAPIKYRFKRIEPKVINIPPGQAGFEGSIVTQSTTNPERIIVLMRPGPRVKDDITKNPAWFGSRFRSIDWTAANDKKSSLTKANVCINGVPLIRTHASDFDDFAYLHFAEMVESTNSQEFGNGVPFENFLYG